MSWESLERIASATLSVATGMAAFTAILAIALYISVEPGNPFHHWTASTCGILLLSFLLYRFSLSKRAEPIRRPRLVALLTTVTAIAFLGVTGMTLTSTVKNCTETHSSQSSEP